MKSLLMSSLMLVSASTLGIGAPIINSPASPLRDQERMALVAKSDDSLLNLRAGAAQGSPHLTLEETTLLASAQNAAPTLATMRAGAVDMSNHDLTVVAVVLLAVLLVIAIA